MANKINKERLQELEALARTAANEAEMVYALWEDQKGARGYNFKAFEKDGKVGVLLMDQYMLSSYFFIAARKHFEKSVELFHAYLLESGSVATKEEALLLMNDISHAHRPPALSIDPVECEENEDGKIVPIDRSKGGSRI